MQDLHAATIDIHLVFHHILSLGKYLWLRLGVFFLQIGLEIKSEVWYNRRAIPPKALAGKTAGVFFYFFADSKMAIGEYHKSYCNQSRGVSLTRSCESEGERGKGNIDNI